MCSASSPLAPSVCATVSTTSAGSRSGARPTQKTPALNSGTSSAAASIASRVFPVPPGPVKVTSRAPSRTSATTSPTSRSRPTKLDAGRGRFVFEIVFSGGNAPRRAGRSRPARRSPSAGARRGRRSSTVDQPSGRRRQQHLTAVRGGHHPRCQMDVPTDVLGRVYRRLARVHPHPDPDRTRLEAAHRLLDRVTAACADANA